MPERCEQELCENWGGDGNVCPCALFDLEPSGPEILRDTKCEHLTMVDCKRCGKAAAERAETR